MGWGDIAGHEGWDAAEFAGGWFSVGSTSGPDGQHRAMVRPAGPDGRLVHDDAGDDQTRDGREAIGWRALCECGWHGPLWKRVATPAEHDPRPVDGGRRIYDAEYRHEIDGELVDTRPWGDSPRLPDIDLEETLRLEWRGHLEPESIAAIREALAAVRTTQGRLTEAVCAARNEGRSWTVIGAAAEMTRQAAHERWSQACPDSAAR